MSSETAKNETSAPATEAELSVLRRLWRRPAPIRELAAALYPGGGVSGYATVQKLLERLEAKGLVGRRRDGRAHVFAARVGRAELILGRLERTAEALCGGSLAPLATQLVSSGRLTPEELAQLRELVDRASRGESEDSTS